jgi:hypothetical protein
VGITQAAAAAFNINCEKGKNLEEKISLKNILNL